MGQYLLKLPKMGESVAEATVTKWLMEVGDKVVLDDGKFNFYLHASNDTINNSKFILVKGTYLLM